MVTQIKVRLQLLFMSRGEAEGPLRTMAALVPDECQLPSPFPCSLAKNAITKITTGGFFPPQRGQGRFPERYETTTESKLFRGEEGEKGRRECSWQREQHMLRQRSKSTAD